MEHIMSRVNKPHHEYWDDLVTALVQRSIESPNNDQWYELSHYMSRERNRDTNAVFGNIDDRNQWMLKRANYLHFIIIYMSPNRDIFYKNTLLLLSVLSVQLEADLFIA